MRCLVVISGMLLLLASCSADYPLRAYFKNGHLYFDGARKAWFFGRTGFCPHYFSVRTKTGEAVWRIETDRSPSDCNLFPLAYGVAPEGWNTVVKPQPLKTGQTYILNGSGGDTYHGAFRYSERRVISVENDAELASQIPDPPYFWNEANAAE